MDHSIIRNKARLVVQCDNQKKGIDFHETFVSIARLEVIKSLLAFACLMDFKFFQIIVKSIFLNGYIAKEIYAGQSPDFENQQSFISLKQAPHASHEKLSKFLLKNDFIRGTIDMTLFTKRK